MTEPQTTRDNARDAKELLDSKILQQAFDDIKKASLTELLTTGSGPYRDDIVARMQALEGLRSQLQHYINSGKMLEKR